MIIIASPLRQATLCIRAILNRVYDALPVEDLRDHGGEGAGCVHARLIMSEPE